MIEFTTENACRCGDHKIEIDGYFVGDEHRYEEAGKCPTCGKIYTQEEIDERFGEREWSAEWE